MTQFLFLVKALLMAMFPGYRLDFPIDQLPSPIMYYESAAATSGVLLAQGDPRFQVLEKVLQKERTGWRYDLSDYAPQHRYETASFKVTCLPGIVVVNLVENGGQWVQISKDVGVGAPLC